MRAPTSTFPADTQLTRRSESPVIRNRFPSFDRPSKLKHAPFATVSTTWYLSQSYPLRSRFVVALYTHWSRPVIFPNLKELKSRAAMR